MASYPPVSPTIYILDKLGLTPGSKKRKKQKEKDPYIPKNPEAWSLDKPSAGWSDLVEKKGKEAGFKGATGSKKKRTAKKPYRGK